MFTRFQDVPRGAFEQRFREVSKGFKRLALRSHEVFTMFQEVPRGAFGVAAQFYTCVELGGRRPTQEGSRGSKRCV